MIPTSQIPSIDRFTAAPSGPPAADARGVDARRETREQESEDEGERGCEFHSWFSVGFWAFGACGGKGGVWMGKSVVDCRVLVECEL